MLGAGSRRVSGEGVGGEEESRAGPVQLSGCAAATFSLRWMFGSFQVFCSVCVVVRTNVRAFFSVILEYELFKARLSN